jgi:hypothetical protein
VTIPQGYYPAVAPPDPEWVGQAFRTQFMNGTPVETRVPSITDLQAEYGGF